MKVISGEILWMQQWPLMGWQAEEEEGEAQ